MSATEHYLNLIKELQETRNLLSKLICKTNSLERVIPGDLKEAALIKRSIQAWADAASVALDDDSAKK